MIDEFMKDVDRCFDTQWRGYDRDQVDARFAAVDRELEIVCLDRDAALKTAADLSHLLEAARAELAEFRVLHAEHSRDNAVAGCVRYLVHLAKQNAESVEADARQRADVLVQRAEEAATRQSVLLDETEQETQRRLAEATRRAREIVGAALEESRSLIAGLTERQRLLDEWYAGTTASVGVPVPRQATSEMTAPADQPAVDGAPLDKASADDSAAVDKSTEDHAAVDNARVDSRGGGKHTLDEPNSVAAEQLADDRDAADVDHQAVAKRTA
jgi:cell division septum initiation protein DivIVA